MLHPENPPGKPGAVERAYADPRLSTFIDFLVAHDRRDARKGVAATRELRRLGISVCLVPVSQSREGR